MDRRQRRGAALAWWLLYKPHLDVLITHQLHTGTPMLSPAPVTPEERKVANDKRVEQHTHLARFTSGFAIPLTLLAQGTGTATAVTSPIHDAQAPVGGSRVAHARKASGQGATQRPIRLERKVLAADSASASSTSPCEGAHSPRREPCAVKEGREQEQIRSCAPDQDEADAPTPGASFQTHCDTSCQHSCPQAVCEHQRSGSCS